jgi:hypothetical protein
MRPLLRHARLIHRVHSYVHRSNQQCRCHDATLARIRRSIVANGRAVPASVVDEYTGRVFVLDGPRIVALPNSWLPIWLRRRLPFVPPPGRYTRVAPSGVSMIDLTR